IYRRHWNTANSGDPRKFTAFRSVLAIDRIEQGKVFGSGKQIPVRLVALMKNPLEEVAALELSQGFAFSERAGESARHAEVAVAELRYGSPVDLRHIREGLFQPQLHHFGRC